MNTSHPTHHLCLTHTLIELEAIKNEAYTRPEAYPLERFMKVTAWTMKALEEAHEGLKEVAR